MNDTTKVLPQSPSADSSTDSTAETRRPRRTWLIVGGVAAACLGLGALVGGTAIAATAGSSDGASPVTAPISTVDSTDPAAGSDDGTTDGTDGSDGSAGSGTATSGTAEVPADAAALTEAVELAVAAAQGVGAESVEVVYSGYEVDVQLSDGSDESVFVALDGTTTVSTERDTPDATPEPVLTAAQIADLVAFVEANAAGAQVDEISTDDGPRSAFDVTAHTADGGEIEWELDADLTILTTDTEAPGQD